MSAWSEAAGLALGAEPSNGTEREPIAVFRVDGVVEGWIAKIVYISLYRQHIWALHGFWRMALDTLSRLIRRQVEPKVKLH